MRLVIWDLDGVFWHGTLTEGGIRYRDEVHDIVIALAQRGIVSSICSKNDPAAAKAVLQERGIWDYFVFPSIDWTPKGGRLRALVEAAQLRPETVLFIDDEPANLAEARHAVPKIRTAGPEVIPGITSSPDFAGGPDAGLSRLEHYRLLDRRRAAAASSGADNLAFLHGSDITLSFDYDIEANIDRAIELINRTNQLNYTKNRLPEEKEAARAQLRRRLAELATVAALVRVFDRYGDYGHVGFFAMRGRFGQSTLLDFCFSCRVLNMGVERFVHRWLGRPAFHAVGEVACDLTGDKSPIDWITVRDSAGAERQAGTPKLIDRLVVRGGCDLPSMLHYLGPLADTYIAELNTAHGGRQFRIDHTAFLNFAAAPPTPEERAALRSIGYVEADWNTGLAVSPKPGAKTVWIVSFWTDAFVYLYKHKTLDLAVPFLGEAEVHADSDLIFLPEERAREVVVSEQNRREYEALKRDFWGIGPAFRELHEKALNNLMQAARGEALVVLILPPEDWLDSKTGRRNARPAEAALNRWTRDAVAGARNARIVAFADFVGPDDACDTMFHYDRLVYARAARHVIGLIREWAGAAGEVFRKTGS